MSITVAKIFKFDDPKNGLGCGKWATVPVTVAEEARSTDLKYHFREDSSSVESR